jgi:hypothetical protein
MIEKPQDIDKHFFCQNILKTQHLGKESPDLYGDATDTNAIPEQGIILLVCALRSYYVHLQL